MKLKEDKFLSIIKEFNKGEYRAVIYVNYANRIELFRTLYSLDNFIKIIYKDSFVYVSKDVVKSGFDYLNIKNYSKDRCRGYISNYKLF